MEPNHPPPANTTRSGPLRLSEDPAFAKRQQRLLENGPDADTAIRAQEAEEAEIAKLRRCLEVEEAASRLWRDRGVRYQECSLDNFEVTLPEQEKKVAELRRFAAGLSSGETRQMGLLLTGPKGTGKDHLVAALMRKAIEAGMTIRWTSGLDLFARMREDIGAGRDECGRRAEYTDPDLLVISDPAWEEIPLTEQQRRYLGAIIDRRWNNRKPIWITINARGAEHAEQLLGGALVDRLRDGALSLACNWGSYRKSIETICLRAHRVTEEEGTQDA